MTHPAATRHIELHRALQGSWAFRSLELEGASMSATLLGQSLLRMEGDRFVMQSAGASYTGVFTIDATQTPPHLDIDFQEGPEAGRRSLGIFTIDDGCLTLCLGLAGAPRPAAFVTTPGSRHALEVLVRAPLHHATPEPPPASSLSPTLAQLQGEWLPVEIVNSGVPVPTSMLPMGRRTQTGDETKVIFGGQTLIHARLRFDEDASPTAVDYLHLSGPAARSTSHGIFQWESGQALFCISAPGDPRPTEFTSPKGSNRTLSRWKR